MSIAIKPFGRCPSGETATLYTLTNASGAWVSITNYGGIVVSLCVPDEAGVLGDVVLGYRSVEEYCPNDGYLGALIGRVGNRIARGRCAVNGRALTLACNSDGNHLHGGMEGFDKKLWTAEPGVDGNRLTLRYTSPDGEEGYPGRLDVTVTYEWSEDDALSIHYEAVSDQDTLVNLTNHAYFNLSGEGSGSVADHLISIDADLFTVAGAGLIPTGELRAVDATPFDLRAPRAIGEGLALVDSDEQMRLGGGYDHNFCLNGQGLREVARLMSPKTHRVMTVVTDQRGMQFYSGNALHGVHPGKYGQKYAPRDGLCLETQNYPDAINHDAFPDAVLRAGARYNTVTIYRFGTV